MPAHLCTEEITAKLPPRLSRVDIETLRPSSSLSDRYVQATVQHRYQHNKVPEPSLKIILNDNGKTIDLLAVGQVADDLDLCEKGDTLVCLKFEVEACPAHYSKRYQMIADDTGSVPSLIWIFKAKGIKKTDTNPADPLPKSIQSTSRPTSYTYKPLAKVDINTIVDVYGIVSFYKAPQKTRGSDYYCNVGLTDPSFDNPEEKLTCNIFSRDLSKLPKLVVGDIVRFHRLKIQNYQGKKQGCNGPGFQWLVFRGLANVQASSSLTYTFEEKDIDKVQSLLTWWSTEGCGVSSTTSKVTLSQVQPREFFDLVCQVIRTCTLEANVCKLWRVWDGTKFQGQIKTVKEEDFNDTVREDEKLMKSSKDLAVDLFLFDNHAAPAEIVEPGDYVHLTNLHAAVVAGQVELTLHGGTWFNRGLKVLSVDSAEAASVKATLDPLIEKSKEFKITDEDDSDSDKEGSVNNDMEEQISTGRGKETITRTRVMKRKNRDIEETEMTDDLNMSGQNKNSIVDKSVGAKGNLQDRSLLTFTEKVSCRRVQETHGINKNGNNYIGAGLSTGVQILHNLSTVSSSHAGNKCCKDLDSHMVPGTSGIGRQNKPNTSVPSMPAQPDRVSPLIVSSDRTSTESLWLSAYDDSDFETELLLAQSSQKQSDTNQAQPGDIQDENISSSGNSNGSPQDKMDIDSQAGKSAQPPRAFTTQNQHNRSIFSSSDESFTTAHSREEEEAPLKSGDGCQKMFLSLKSNKPKQAKPEEDRAELLVFTQEDYSSMDSCVLCFETAQFTESDEDCQTVALNRVPPVEETERDSAIQLSLLNRKAGTAIDSDVHLLESSMSSAQHMSDIATVEGSEVSSSSESCEGERKEEPPPRCMLKTASVILGHTHVPVTRLKDALVHDVPHKFRILVRLQDFHPRPATAHDLVYFCCDFCHFFTSASKLWNSRRDSSVSQFCPNCTRPLKPAIIMTLLLTDENYSLQAFLWDKSATQFFNGVDPVQLLSNERDSQQISQWMEELCPLGSSVKDRPLLECCVFSYHAGEDVKYQIFDTTLVT